MALDPLPPPVPGNAAIWRLLAERVDACRLSPGLVVGVTEAGRRRYVAHGATAIPGPPVDEATLFEIGSVTKLFTSLLLADMAARGEAGLDEPVAALLPPGTAVPSRDGRAITLLDLARHVSGLPRLPGNLAPSDPRDPYAHYTARHLYDALAGYELPRMPGAAAEYSNLGVGLLGHALALRAGLPYEALLHARILAPLGLHATTITLPPALDARMAVGHDADGAPVPRWDMAVLAGAGGLRSCAADLLAFLEALMDPGSPLGPAASRLAAPLAQGGMGLGLAQPDGSVSLEHDGGTGGFRAWAGCVPAWRRGVVALGNSAIAVADLGIHLRDTRWGMLWHRREVALAPGALARVTGRYRMTPHVVLDVTGADGKLFVQLTGQPALRAYPASGWHVFYKVVAAQITFQPGPDGRAARLVLHQNGLDRIAERIA